MFPFWTVLQISNTLLALIPDAFPTHLCSSITHCCSKCGLSPSSVRVSSCWKVSVPPHSFNSSVLLRKWQLWASDTQTHVKVLPCFMTHWGFWLLFASRKPTCRQYRVIPTASSSSRMKIIHQDSHPNRSCLPHKPISSITAPTQSTALVLEVSLCTVRQIS